MHKKCNHKFVHVVYLTQEVKDGGGCYNKVIIENEHVKIYCEKCGFDPNEQIVTGITITSTQLGL